MKIGIDIDDVIVEFARVYLIKYTEKYGKEFDFENLFSFNLWEPLKISKEEDFSLADEYYDSSDFENIPLLEKAKESILELSKYHELIFITSRPLKIKEKTLSYLNKHFSGINHNIFFTNDIFKNQIKSKVEVRIQENVDFMIEDNKDYALSCANNGINIILFDKPWNKNIEHENIRRVDNWKEAMIILKNAD